MAPAASLAVLLLLQPSIGAAETLLDAITLAYQTNPALRAQRAQLRSTDEGYVQARSGYGPQIGVSGQYGYNNARVESFLPGHGVNDQASTGTADLTATQPLYTTGATDAAVKGASANVLAAREALRQAEDQLLQNVVTAYMDVRRDRETIQILKDEIVALTGEFNEIKAKGALGAVTKTDVAQSEERLLSAQAQLNLAYGRLNASNAEYLNYVGQSPGELAPEPDLPGLPPAVDQAFEAADHNNPQLLQAVDTERAAREKVNEAKAANGPTVSLKLDANISPYAPYLQGQYDRSVSASVVFSQPLFTSGMNSSKIRQALDDDNRAMLDIENARRGVAQAWDQMVSTRGALTIEQRQLAVELIAVEGNRIEERVGQRSTIDLLNAELELANARVSLVQSRHDEYVARAALLSAMGLLELRFLTPGAATYDPVASFKKVEKLGSTPIDGVIAKTDAIAAPITPAPRSSTPDAGAERPADMPTLPRPSTKP
jgi:outer membrane protein